MSVKFSNFDEWKFTFKSAAFFISYVTTRLSTVQAVSEKRNDC